MINPYPTTLLLSLIAPTFFGGERENSATHPGLPRNGDARTIREQEDSNRLCLASLKAYAGPRKLSQLSAFRAFNRYPPGPSSISDPGQVKLSNLRRVKLADECLSYMPFEFDVFQRGELRRGKKTDLHPIHVWAYKDSYMAVYIYKKYTHGDYEGDSIVMSAVVYDTSGHTMDSIEHLSWWHSIEGTILVHDATFSPQGISVVENVFDPDHWGANGDVLKYVNLEGEKVVRKYAMEGGKYIEIWSSPQLRYSGPSATGSWSRIASAGITR